MCESSQDPIFQGLQVKMSPMSLISPQFLTLLFTTVLYTDNRELNGTV